MEQLANREIYIHGMALMIEKMGSMAVSIANRWQLGWPDRVAALLAAGTYLIHLESQREREVDVLANEAGLRHLSRREILQVYEIKESPP